MAARKDEATQSPGGSDQFVERAMYRERIGNRIRSIMRRKGVSRGELSRRTGLSKSYVSYICSGSRSPSPLALRRVADALRVPVDEILPRV